MKKPLAERIVDLVLKEGGDPERGYEALINVLAALCMCADEPISAAQDMAGDLVREVTERIMGHAAQ